ncbi:hypothetical protein AV530_006520 [Patagioenas fasciata monilis]|uniref:Uncharacterized protein n=1 Tax=Patagioenas fasciata monilis TaxID=372326 RepID=A0A1V4KGV2_PATFA|nr:hypothetical protein AV530_006520 [Patagioenas fasciata monilis]
MLWQSRPLAAGHPVALPWSYNPGSPSVHPWARISCPHYKKSYCQDQDSWFPPWLHRKTLCSSSSDKAH